MKSSFRPRAAAAAFLVALTGAAFVAPSAVQAQTFIVPSFAPQEVVTRFEMFGTPALGREVVYRLYGKENGFARFSVPGVLNDWEMKEVERGVYEGRYILAPGNDPRAFAAATAVLQWGGRFVTARVGTPGLTIDPPVQAHQGPVALPPVAAPNPRARDRQGPAIGELTPSSGDRVRDRGNTRISARFSDDNSGIDPASVNLRVDGRDVTRASRVDGDSVHYREDLAPGRHVAELTVRDRAGNVSRRSWTFEVTGSGRYGNNYGYGYGDDRRW